MSTASKFFILAVLILAGGLFAMRPSPPSSPTSQPSPSVAEFNTSELDTANLDVATFAGGCFWSMEEPFEKLPGVASVVSGYTGGSEPYPTYYQVARGRTGHLEAVEVRFDPQQVSYEDLLEVYWRNIDPTDDGGQFADRGGSYRSTIFVHTDEQREAAEASKLRMETSGRFKKRIVTQIVPASMFYPAEEEHQDFYRLQPAHHQACFVGSGRARFLTKTWGDDAEFIPKRRTIKAMEPDTDSKPPK
jgi:methionine-S-sulfoxide reductase